MIQSSPEGAKYASEGHRPSTRESPERVQSLNGGGITPGTRDTTTCYALKRQNPIAVGIAHRHYGGHRSPAM